MNAITSKQTAEDLKVGDFNTRNALTPIRRVYGEALLKAAREDERIVALSADLTSATEIDLFRDELPKRFFQVGIAEANMIGIAGGMARSGDMPFVHTFSVFATRRCYDQIAMQLAYPRCNAKIVGFIPGLTTLLGVSHQAIDDIALMRALPNMTVIEPADVRQIPAAVRAAVAHDGPVYLRLRRPDGPPPADMPELPLQRGQRALLREGKDGVILACGLMCAVAETAAERLAKQGLSVAVANLATLKPLDEAGVIELAKRFGTVVTAENHSIIGGLGSAVAECLLEAGVRVGFERVGVRDCFAEGGTTPYLLTRYGLDANAIVAAFQRAHGRRG
ncbi:MAG: transketolase C-terminal domain-containing protein [Ideonella sp.]